MTVKQQEESTQDCTFNSRQNRPIQTQHSEDTADCCSVGDRWTGRLPCFLYIAVDI